MKILSWNVNGVRAAMNKGLLQALRESDADVFCLQETRAAPEQVKDADWPKQYRQYWRPSEKAGYAGVATFTRREPANVSYGMGVEKHDREGRLVTLEFEEWYVVNVYTPNAQRGLTRLEYRTQEWDADFLKYLKKLRRKKPVIFCGDLNVAHKEIDLANPKNNVRNAGFTIEERESFDRILKSGFVDAFREFVSEGGHYTWWSYRFNARQRNIGWRIDYIAVSEELRGRLKDAFIRPDIHGSDHCPVGAVLE